MPATVHALLVGIDNYRSPVTPLSGCVNDVRHLRTYLEGRIGEHLRPATLLDGQATRQALIDTFRSHLGQAKSGEVALFAFSGHGTEEPCPTDIAALEPSGKLQVLMCADSGSRVAGKLTRGIADKELAVLIAEIADRDAHVAVILDCCHSGSGTRDPFVRIRQWLPDPDSAIGPDHDLLAELASPRDVGDFLAGAIDRWAALPPAAGRDAVPGAEAVAGAPRLDHVALSACQSFEVAKEQPVGNETRGAFSVALLAALEHAGSTTTYRDLLAGARSRVERATAEQTPVLFPVDAAGPADGLFLDGSVQRKTPRYHVTKTAGGFEVDAGLVHGLAAPNGDEHFELTCTSPAGIVAGQVKVVAVDVGRSRVEAGGWIPDNDVVYDAVVSVVPLPPAIITFDTDVIGEPAKGYHTETYELVRQVIATCGPGGGPSPFVREGDPATDPAPSHLRVAAHAYGYRIASTAAAADGDDVVAGAWTRLLRGDGTPVAPDVPGVGEEAASLAVGRLEHVARWQQLLGLEAPASALSGAVRLDLYEARAGETTIPTDRPPLAAAGGYDLAYAAVAGAYVHPSVFMTLSNATSRDLYVALLDLTDRFACHAALFPTQRLTAGHTAAVWNGAPIPVELPAGRAVRPGALVRDWLKLIVSDRDFNASAFELQALDEPPTRSPTQRSITSSLERLAARALTRTIGSGGPPPAAPEWATTTIPVITCVPS